MSKQPEAMAGYTPEQAADRLPFLEHNLLKLDERVSQTLERMALEIASMRREPGPYTELASAIKALQDDHAVLKRLMASVEVMVELQTTPQLTVRHWLAEDGVTWRYETLVSLKPETAEAMPNTLAWADQMARAEAKRRQSADAQEQGAKALGSNHRHG